MIKPEQISRAEWILRRPEKKVITFAVIVRVLPANLFPGRVGAGLKITISQGKPQYTAVDIELNETTWIRKNSPTRNTNWKSPTPVLLTPAVRQMLDSHRSSVIRVLKKAAKSTNGCRLEIFTATQRADKIETTCQIERPLEVDTHQFLLSQIHPNHMEQLLSLFQIKIEELPTPIQHHLVPKLL